MRGWPCCGRDRRFRAGRAGNVVHGGTWADSYECDQAFATGSQSTKQLDYVARTETVNLQSQSIVLNDRQR